MSYLEELLPEFRNGAKIRRKDWGKSSYVVYSDGTIRDEDNCPISYEVADWINNLLADDWEFYQEPIDWDYIIKNKCLCWFWDEDETDSGFMGLLVQICENAIHKYCSQDLVGCGSIMKNCRPVRRDEVTFYEDRKDE